MLRSIGLAGAIALVLLSSQPAPAQAAADTKLDLCVVYVGDTASERGKAFARFLRQRFAAATPVARTSFTPEQARDADVVLLDWPQSARQEAFAAGATPLGGREGWSKPTVLVGSAGLLVAREWQTRGWFG